MTLYSITLSSEMKALMKAFEQKIQQIAKAMASAQVQQKIQQFPEWLVNFDERVAEIQKEIKSITEKLARRGWYPSNEMDLPFAYAIETAFNGENVGRVDEMMSQFVSKRLGKLNGLFAEKFPDRASILSSAIEAHRLDQYTLSVPIFLIQAEGICLDIFGVKLYSKSKKKNGYPLVAEKIEQLDLDKFTAAFLHPLTEPLGISASEDYRSDYPDCLNRHLILHGIDVGYNSQTNSLKALSLLEYVATILCDAKNDIAPQT